MTMLAANRQRAYSSFKPNAIADDSLRKKLEDSERDMFSHWLTPFSRQWEDPMTRFLTLKRKWEEETRFLSSMQDICMSDPYQQIIGMGPIAIKYILSAMKEKPQHWFWALRAITGDDPVPSEHKGRIRLMTEDWLKWGKEQG